MTATRVDGHYLVVGRTADGAPFALDGRCPHEGYPLVQGDVKDGALTCRWHNWKFDVTDGRCLLGGEGVRAYPAREQDGRIAVDLAAPDPELQRTSLRASLEQALSQGDLPRALRDSLRLIEAGEDPWRLLADVARHDATHAEDGATHVLALATDCGRLLPTGGGPRALAAIAPVLELCADTNVRQPLQPVPAALPGATGAGLRAAVEAEQLERALGLLRGAFADGQSRATIEAWLLAAVSDHFTDFGHQLIYLVKAAELLDHLDGIDHIDGTDTAREHAEALYIGWLRGLTLATRDDTLPTWRRYAERTAALAPDLPRLAAAARPGTPHDGPALRDAVLDGTAQQAVDALVERLSAGVPVDELARWLVAAAAHRLLRFDVAIDGDPQLAEGWLWATHRFTFASAVRVATTRERGEAAVRLLLQAVAFVHSGAALDRAPAERIDLAVGPADLLELDALTAAIAQRDAPRAVRACAAWLASDRDPAALRAAVLELGRGEHLVRPIVVAHAIKTTCAAWEEYDALAGHPDRAVPVLAAVQLLASPIVERRARGLVDEAIGWVIDKRVPRRLTR